MDDLVEAILLKLQLRQEQVLEVSCQDFASKAHSISDFIDHQKISLRDVGAIQLAKLAKLDAADPMTIWLLQGLEYGCEFTVQLGFSALCLIPNELYEWPIVLKTIKGKQLKTFPKKVITYSEVALLKEEDVLIRFRHQQLTDLANEYLTKKKIQQIERF